MTPEELMRKIDRENLALFNNLNSKNSDQLLAELEEVHLKNLRLFEASIRRDQIEKDAGICESWDKKNKMNLSWVTPEGCAYFIREQWKGLEVK